MNLEATNSVLRTNLQRSSLSSQPAAPVTSLYVHVPFCAQKCVYCAFYSEPSDGGLVNRYVKALIRELESIAPNLKPTTLFFGGGTPSLLNLRQWTDILEAVQRLNLLGASEWTIECNPATVSLEKARLLRSFGVNRVSMGIQSLDEDLLDRLGRIHSREMAFKSFGVLQKAGFENINLDLMFAIPGQTLAVWRETLREAVAMGSQHLSTYEVIYEEDTPLYRQMAARKFDIDEDLACAMYDVLVEEALKAGFIQYEIANFARPRDRGHDLTTPSASTLSVQPSTLSAGDWENSYACRHNVNYWRGGFFYGVGPSATGYVQGKRSKNWADTQKYCDLIERGESPVESNEELEPIARAGETAAFGLRMVQGWPFDVFHSVTGFDLRDAWRGDMQRLVERGWAVWEPERFRLTAQGLRFADAAAEMFLR